MTIFEAVSNLVNLLIWDGLFPNVESNILANTHFALTLLLTLLIVYAFIIRPFWLLLKCLIPNRRGKRKKDDVDNF